MRAHSLAVTSLLRGVATLAFVSLAHADVTRGGPTGPVLLSCAGRATLANCESAAFLAQCGSAVCASTFVNDKAAFDAQQGAALSSEPSVPELASDGGIQSAATQSYVNALKVTVAPNTLEGKSLPIWLALQQENANLAAASQPKHKAWSDDGQVVSSCAEYVTQQYWDYELFNDTAKALGTDYWSIIQAASLPTGGIMNRTLYELGTGRAQYSQLGSGNVYRWLARHPKNAFFWNSWDSLNYTSYAEGKGAVPSWIPAGLAALLSNPQKFDYGTPEMAWHQQMIALQAPNGKPAYSQAQYDQVNQRMARYAALIDKAFAAGVTDAVLEYEQATANTPCVKSDGPNSACAIAVPTMNGGYVGVAPPLNVAQYGVVGQPARGGFDMTAETNDGTWVSEYLALHANEAQAAADAALAAEQAVGTDPTIAAARSERARWELVAMKYLVDEWNQPGNGCFGASSTLCDWRPKLFALSWTNYFAQLESQLYRTCVAATGDNFAALRYADAPDCTNRRKQDYWFPPLPAAVPSTPPATYPAGHPYYYEGQRYQEDYTISTDAVNELIGLYQTRDRIWASYDATELAMAREIDGMPVDTTLKGFTQSTSDSGNLGDPSTFTGNYAYTAHWDVEQPPTNGATTMSDGETRVCRLNGNMSAGLTANVSAFGVSEPVLDVGYQAYATDAKSGMNAHFNVMGDDLYSPNLDGQATTAASQYGTFSVTVPIGSTSLGNLYVDDQWILVAGILPVHLKVYFATTASATEALSMNNPSSCAGGDPAQRKVVFSLDGGVTPSVQADLVGDASIDIGIADAGVRADLNLVTLSMPFTMGIDVGPGTLGPRTVSFSEGLDADTDELGGSVSVYADVNYLVGSAHYSDTLFSWNGFHQHAALWHPPSSLFDLDALSVRVYPSFLQAGGQPIPAVCPTNPVRVVTTTAALSTVSTVSR